MKLKRSKYISLLFLVSFFFSISANIYLGSLSTHASSAQLHSKDHSQVKEHVISCNINDLLFEENENENEMDLDLSLMIVPFFLETFTALHTPDLFQDSHQTVIATAEPIYKKVSNFRI